MVKFQKDYISWVLFIGLIFVIHKIIIDFVDPYKLEGTKTWTCPLSAMYSLNYHCQEILFDEVQLFNSRNDNKTPNRIVNLLAIPKRSETFPVSKRLEFILALEISIIIKDQALVSKVPVNMTFSCSFTGVNASIHCPFRMSQIYFDENITQYLVILKILNLDELSKQGLSGLSFALITPNKDAFLFTWLFFAISLASVFTFMYLEIKKDFERDSSNETKYILAMNSLLIIFNMPYLNFTSQGSHMIIIFKSIVYSGQITLLIGYCFSLMERISERRTNGYMKISKHFLLVCHFIGLIFSTCIRYDEDLGRIDRNFVDTSYTMWEIFLVIVLYILGIWALLLMFPALKKLPELEQRDQQSCTLSISCIICYILLVIKMNLTIQNRVVFKGIITFCTIILRILYTKSTKAYKALPTNVETSSTL